MGQGGKVPAKGRVFSSRLFATIPIDDAELGEVELQQVGVAADVNVELENSQLGEVCGIER